MPVARGSQLMGGGAQELDAQGRTYARADQCRTAQELPEYIAHPPLAATEDDLLDARAGRVTRATGLRSRDDA